MKKVLNVFGVLGSIFLTFILTIVLICFVLVLNVRCILNEDGINKSLKNMNVVDTIKTVDDGLMWEDFIQMSDDLNLTEKQLEDILNSESIKEEFGEILSGMIGSITGDKVYNISKDEFIDLIDIVIDEYNKVADEKISVKDRDELVNSITDEYIAELNSSMGDLNLLNTVGEDEKQIVEAVDYVLFGEFVTGMIVVIVVLIALIALFRFSYYKWMSYVGVASLLVSMFPLAIGVVLNIVPMNKYDGLEILTPFKDTLATNLFITAGILFGVYVVAFILNSIFKKINYRKQLKAVEEDVVTEQVNDIEQEDVIETENNE